MGHTSLFICTSDNVLLETGYFRSHIVVTLDTSRPSQRRLLLVWSFASLVTWLKLNLLHPFPLQCAGSLVPAQTPTPTPPLPHGFLFYLLALLSRGYPQVSIRHLLITGCAPHSLASYWFPRHQPGESVCFEAASKLWGVSCLCPCSARDGILEFPSVMSPEEGSLGLVTPSSRLPGTTAAGTRRATKFPTGTNPETEAA